MYYELFAITNPSPLISLLWNKDGKIGLNLGINTREKSYAYRAWNK
jgi:hypothetical protein